MTKRHFERLAAAMRALKASPEGHRPAGSTAGLTAEQFEEIVDQLTLACFDLNPRFDMERFRDACGA